MEMQNIIIINGVRQSGVTTKAKELKEKIEGLGLGYKVAMRHGSESINLSGDFDYMIIERLYDEGAIKLISRVANVKIINLDESDIVMRMIGEDLSKENVKKQVKCYLDFKRGYVNTLKRWD
jgi:hypothetical protein